AHTIDHVQPKSRGGADSWENLVAACLRCNNTKGDHTPSEMGWKLRIVPEPPHGTIWQIKELEKPTPAWDPFLLPERAA
ncbi:HNH endonuclease, partial [Arthrobacter sp. HMWF013]|uniref:HNH endonuclease n=1 Tax=Arthrobacter sp. HMWF013 TaxID=2056849 RepID=UPI000D3F1E8D